MFAVAMGGKERKTDRCFTFPQNSSQHPEDVNAMPPCPSFVPTRTRGSTWCWWTRPVQQALPIACHTFCRWEERFFCLHAWLSCVAFSMVRRKKGRERAQERAKNSQRYLMRSVTLVIRLANGFSFLYRCVHPSCAGNDDAGTVCRYRVVMECPCG